MTEQQIIVCLVLLAALVAAALWTVVTTLLLRAVVGLAVTSAVVTVLLFQLNAPLAGVFELSVCAGLIPAIFLSAISVTKRLKPEAMAVEARQQVRRFWALPLLIVVVGLLLTQVHLPELVGKVAGATGASGTEVRDVMWKLRHMDVLGQIVILLAGAFGVVVLLKEPKHG
jgi:NADH-quinone oxidoreductase subunit J